LKTLLAIAAVLVSGCATARMVEGDAGAWPSVALGSMPSHATQVITVTRDGATRDFTAVIEGDASHLVVAGLGSMGPRLFKVTKTPAGVTAEASPLVPSSFKPEHMLADLELAYASSASLHNAFNPTGWSLEEAGLTRIARYKGVLVSTVTRSSEDPWAGPVELENARFGYHLHVETLDHE
jgi:hypothetical protein